jgi:HSP20 family molecular chaperone IbpA
MSLLNSLIPAFARPSVDSVADASRDSSAEPGVRPVYSVTESADAYALTVQLPGVAKSGLNITDENGVLTIRGERSWKQPAGWTSLYRESSDRPFELSLEHDQSIDVDKIRAELNDGVLNATLPKAEARKPRKITVA